MKSDKSSIFTTILAFLCICLMTATVAEGGVPQQIPMNNSPVSGPDYIITDISLPKEASWVEPGMIITPNITIRNAGGDDTAPGTINISASLGDYPLISRSFALNPMKGGEERKITVEYQIPDGIPSKGYPLIVSLDPGREPEGTDTSNNKKKSSETLNFRSVSQGVKVNSCGCS